MSYLGKDLVFCPGFTNSMNMVDYLDIWLTASDQTTVPEPPENYFLSISSVWKNIQEATGISKEKFAKNLQLDGQNFCFSTPLSLWANW
jgi:hypothetical protein